MIFAKTIAAALLLVPTATWALDMEITDIECEYRAFSPSFDFVCNDDMLCTFGEEATLQGQLKYTGLSYLNFTADDSLTLDVDLEVKYAGTTRTRSLFDQVLIPLCHDSLVASENNVDGECPNDGDFNFSTSIFLPTMDGQLLSWFSSGRSGKVNLYLYNNTDDGLLGNCFMTVNTKVSGSQGKSIYESAPSGKTAGMIIAGFLIATLGCCLVCAFKKKKAVVEEDPSSFTRMEEKKVGPSSTTKPNYVIEDSSVV